MNAIDKTSLGLAGEIALLVMKNENAREDSARAERDLARAMRQEAAESEVSALRDAADALETGAWVSGSITFLGGGLTVAAGVLRLDADCDDTLKEADLLGDSGGVLGRLAEPADTLVGQSGAQRHQASAKEAAFAGEQAAWQSGDASDSLRRVDRNRDRALDLVESINRAEQAATDAVVQNV